MNVPVLPALSFQAVGSIATSVSDPAVAEKQAAGVRDIVAHGEYRIDYETLWEIIIIAQQNPKKFFEKFSTTRV